MVKGSPEREGPGWSHFLGVEEKGARRPVVISRSREPCSEESLEEPRLEEEEATTSPGTKVTSKDRESRLPETSHCVFPSLLSLDFS